MSYIIFQLSSFRELDKFLQGQQAGSFHIFITVTLHFIPYISLHYIPLPYITFQLSSFRESDRFLTEAAGAGLEDRRPTSEAGLEQKETLECLTDHPDDINIPHIIALLAPHTFSLHLLVHTHTTCPGLPTCPPPSPPPWPPAPMLECQALRNIYAKAKKNHPDAYHHLYPEYIILSNCYLGNVHLNPDFLLMPVVFCIAM